MKSILVAFATLFALGTVAHAQVKQKTGIEVKGPTFYEQCVTAGCKNAHFKTNETARTKREQEHFWKHQLQLGSVGAVGGGGGSE